MAVETVVTVLVLGIMTIRILVILMANDNENTLITSIIVFVSGPELKDLVIACGSSQVHAIVPYTFQLYRWQHICVSVDLQEQILISAFKFAVCIVQTVSAYFFKYPEFSDFMGSICFLV